MTVCQCNFESEFIIIKGVCVYVILFIYTATRQVNILASFDHWIGTHIRCGWVWLGKPSIAIDFCLSLVSIVLHVTIYACIYNYHG